MPSRSRGDRAPRSVMPLAVAEEERGRILDRDQSLLRHAEHADLVDATRTGSSSRAGRGGPASSRPRSKARCRRCARVSWVPRSRRPFVTWPTTNTVVPLSFAKRMSRAAHSRTWPTFPGAPSRSPVKTVWIESTIIADGARRAAVARIVSSIVSPSSPRRPTVRQAVGAQLHLERRLLARDVQGAAMPAACSCAATWRRSVDLPAPGSPPSSTMEPGTIPPPSTKSNSRGRCAGGDLRRRSHRECAAWGRPIHRCRAPRDARLAPRGASDERARCGHFLDERVPLAARVALPDHRSARRRTRCSGRPSSLWPCIGLPAGSRLRILAGPARSVTLEARELLVEIQVARCRSARCAASHDDLGAALRSRAVPLSRCRRRPDVVDLGTKNEHRRGPRPARSRPTRARSESCGRLDSPVRCSGARESCESAIDRDRQFLGEHLERARDLTDLLLPVLGTRGPWMSCR